MSLVYMIAEKGSEQGAKLTCAEIQKDTEKAYMVDSKKFKDFPCRVQKSTMNTIIGKTPNMKMYGLSKDELLDSWNKELCSLIKEGEDLLGYYKNLIVVKVEEITPLRKAKEKIKSKKPKLLKKS